MHAHLPEVPYLLLQFHIFILTVWQQSNDSNKWQPDHDASKPAHEHNIDKTQQHGQNQTSNNKGPAVTQVLYYLLAQLSAQNKISIQQKFCYDVTCFIQIGKWKDRKSLRFLCRICHSKTLKIKSIFTKRSQAKDDRNFIPNTW